ncbi:MAG: amylosucrase [Methylotenera sp.]|nr:amylosucrase [Methylotenera sp.]
MLSVDKAIAKLIQKNNEFDADKALAAFIQTQKNLGANSVPREFLARLKAQLPTLIQQLGNVYVDYPAFELYIQNLIATMYASYNERPSALKALDQKRAKNPTWFQSQKMVGGVCYVDLYAKNLSGIRAQIPYFKSLGLTYLHLMPLFKAPPLHNDGGYAVSSYREVNPQLGSMVDLNILADELREAGISLVLDFIFNHTSNEHEWAQKCFAGDVDFQDFYLIYPDRTIPDLFEKNVREIFPEEHPGAFSQLEDGRWVWTTFHSYQWDLNYANPNVFLAMACEMLFIANQGAEVLRMDAVAFLWKKMGSDCENLPEVHTLIQAFNTIAKIAAPSLLFKSEAIVHPDDVIKYIAKGECQLSYNPLQMALLWSTLATREVNLLNQALSERNTIAADCSWVNYVRSHDDIGWTFSDEDAEKFAINGYMHREFLNNFYLGRFPGSFAQGVPFQENLKNGDCRISGTTASLVGLGQQDNFAIERILALYNIVMTTGGIPLIYLGDEVGMLNDLGYVNDEAKAADSRWVHRVAKNPLLYKEAQADKNSATAKLFNGLKHLITLRKKTKALAGGLLKTINTRNASVIAYSRVVEDESVLVIANFSENPQRINLDDSYSREMLDLVTNKHVVIQQNLTIAPYHFMWLK